MAANTGYCGYVGLASAVNAGGHYILCARKTAGCEAPDLGRPRLNPSQHGCATELVTETGLAVQISVHRPSPFISQNLERVIPDWNLPVSWVVVVLQQSRFALAETAPHVEREKDRLREKFMRFGFEVAFNLRNRGFLTDLIDPRTGYPLLSRPGEISHDDTAVVQALLSFPVTTGNCSTITHPTWGTSIYPGILMSSASPTIIKSVLKRVATQQGWTASKSTTDFLLSLAGV